MHSLSDYDFALPPELIAQQPADKRSSARLLDASLWPAVHHRQVADLPLCVRPGDLLVLNDTQVIKARMFGHKATGGAVELLIERILPTATPDTWQYVSHMRVSKKPAVGAVLTMAGGRTLQVLGRWPAEEQDQPSALFLLQGQGDPWSWLEQAGHLPLPPYITRPHAQETAEDRLRYQTVFARVPGAVAAPTAALHFDAPLLQALAELGVQHTFLTLHVGAGTFAPVKTADIHAHTMHAERYAIPDATLAQIAKTQAEGGRIIAVGTTVVRSLESWAQTGQQTGDTRIFMTPGFEFRVVDMLMTNFHLPKSTLLMLVAAFIGLDTLQALYTQAIAARYRFFSYGDAMLLSRQART